jgi:hypothetical protein
VAARNYGRGVRAALVSLCRGTCYWPGCPEPVLLIEDDCPVLRLDIAHICAAEPGGPRYDPNLPDPDIFSNLMLMCRAHHKIIDQIEPQRFSVALLRKWKADREDDGVAALAGLRNLTESRLQEIVSESYEAITEKLDDALARFAQIDSEGADLLRMLRDELLDFSPGTFLDLDAASMVRAAARDLAGLQDTADVLLHTANRLSGLSDTAEALSGAADDLSNLPEMVEALSSVVKDMKRYGPEY